ncbi:hypothetical protein AB4238_10085 [Shewanella sp. 10N.286.45.A1]|uniref:hypothetical protein n=1 Tax=Shewanella sp. 10N.286.45.A1 TaxID=3229694 RepID=UPI00354BA90D
MINVIILTAALSTISAEANQQETIEVAIVEKTTLLMELQQQLDISMAILAQQVDTSITDTTLDIAFKTGQKRTTNLLTEKPSFIAAD